MFLYNSAAIPNNHSPEYAFIPHWQHVVQGGCEHQDCGRGSADNGSAGGSHPASRRYNQGQSYFLTPHFSSSLIMCKAYRVSSSVFRPLYSWFNGIVVNRNRQPKISLHTLREKRLISSSVMAHPTVRKREREMDTEIKCNAVHV